MVDVLPRLFFTLDLYIFRFTYVFSHTISRQLPLVHAEKTLHQVRVPCYPGQIESDNLEEPGCECRNILRLFHPANTRSPRCTCLHIANKSISYKQINNNTTHIASANLPVKMLGVQDEGSKEFPDEATPPRIDLHR
jgi:hypothetical protein